MKLYVMKKFVPGSLFLRGQVVMFDHLTPAGMFRKVTRKNVADWWIEKE